jgi:hypothetical protein
MELIDDLARCPPPKQMALGDVFLPVQARPGQLDVVPTD